jgi:hypothetical protein
MRRGFMIAFLCARLAFNQRVVWHDDQLIAYLQIGISAHVTVNSGTLWIKEIFEFVADAFADREADNRAVRAIDEHIVDRAKQSAALRHHFVTDHVGHAWKALKISESFFHRRSTHCDRVRSDRMQSRSGNDAARSPSSDNRFAMYDDKSSDALAVTLHNDFLDSAEALRGFHVDDSARDQLTSFNHFEPSFPYFIYTLNSRSKNAR